MRDLSRLPPALAEIAKTRDYLTTAEFGNLIRRAGTTIRQKLCEQKHVYGIRPIKVGGRLAWPIEEVAKILGRSDSAEPHPADRSCVSIDERLRVTCHALLRALKDCVAVMENEVGVLRVIQPELIQARAAITAAEELLL
ncbi:MAG: hypothetical protein M0Z99_02010 [Betaproteobacteria bacterium]|nr:hypothetical protein [Betaproteobacteria bacterium]